MGKLRISHERKWWFGIASLVVLSGVVFGIIGSQTARADYGVVPDTGCTSGRMILGRALCHGYFTDSLPQSGESVLRNGIFASNGTDFLNQMYAYLYDTDPTMCGASCTLGPALVTVSQGSWNQSSAAAVINALLGVNGTAFGSTAVGIQYARDHFGDFTAIVMDYEARGLVTWNITVPIGAVGSNDFHSSGDPNAGDMFFRDETSPYMADVIWFRNTDGSTAARIERDCGNLVSFMNPLTNQSFAVVVNAGPGGNVNPGDTVTMPVSLTNTSAVQASVNGTLVAYNNGGARVTAPCAGSCTPGGSSDLNSGISVGANHGYNVIAPSIAGKSGPGWYWNTNPLGVSMVSSGSVQFTVSALAPAGNFNIEVCFTPTDPLGGSECVVVNYNVIVTTRYPGISAQNGDVYAGGGVCGGVMSLLSPIRGNLDANSYGDYVVAASGNINHFSSNRGSNTLNLGANGGYATLCRPDLLAVAAAYTGPRGSDIAGPSFNVSGKSGVFYYYGAGTLQISGNVSGNLTIVAPNGSVLISGQIQVDPGGFSARALPGLGVIARNNISIAAGVTRVDAYLFSSQGRIDTCLDHSAGCANQLTVNGFLMARQMSFSRLGAPGAGAVIAERVVLSPQIYLNPPPLFSSSVATISLDGQGEKQPLF